ncbi:hypothetical protein AB0K18_42960 [Nonomuraea sp. NPDC049421]|uniref:hypothetical protein n=1 Tax=Nonomuraea sp. NPDC049421 TaxID=3155275 RepID=UPI003413DCAD
MDHDPQPNARADWGKITRHLATNALADRLRAGAADHEPHRQAALELLIADDHSRWLDNETFTAMCVYENNDRAYINWRGARDAFDNGAFDKSSTTERAILDYAIALGEDRFKFHLMDDRQRALLAAATVRAIDPIIPAGVRLVKE